MQLLEEAFRLGQRVRDPYAIAARGAIRFENSGKTNSGNPCSQLIGVADDLGERNPKTLVSGHTHEGGSGIHHRKTLRITKRTLDQGTNRRVRPPLTLLLGMKTVQMLSGKVIPRDNAIRPAASDGASQRAQGRQTVVNIRFAN